MWFIARRLGFYAVAVWVALTVNFAIPRVMPGNAVDTLLTKFPTLDAASLHALQAEFGAHTHGSLISQYFSYLGATSSSPSTGRRRAWRRISSTTTG